MKTEAQKAIRRISSRAHYAANRERIRESLKQWHAKHPGKIAEYSRERRKREPKKTKEECKKWKKKNPECARKAQRKWAKNNRAKINFNERRRCATDPAYKIAKNLRCQLRLRLRQQFAGKTASALTIVGCDISFLMGYLEARFKPGMKWSNYGKVWEIDHRIPCVSFDLTDASHQRSCFHYSNLQPLFVVLNRQKWSKMLPTHQAELI